MVWLRSPAVGLASAVPVLALASGCQLDDDDSFRITRVEYDGQSTLTLSFSEAIGELDGIDPESFRLSFAVTYSYTYSYGGVTYTYGYTQYEDLGWRLVDDYDYGFMPLVFSSLTPGSSASQIVLEASEPWGPACEFLTELQAELDELEADAEADFAIFLHYAASNPAIVSASGRLLGDIGEDWVIDDLPYSQRDSYGFILSPQLRIPCP